MNLLVESTKKVCTTQDYIEYFLALASAITWYISISGIRIGITGFAIGLTICVVEIKRHNSIIKKKKKKHYNIVALAKSELNKIEVLLSKTLIDSNISHDEFFLINIALWEYDKKKEVIKNLKTDN